MILMVNMTGYFLGHYPQHFDLDDDQRTLILQTMMFFFWLAGGAAVFSKVCGFTYTDALYFCDVTVLTIGFGDIVAPNDAGRGLVFPYAVLGIIFLGLMINSIRKFAAGLSKDNIIKKHQLRDRERTFGRSVTSEKELRDRLGLPPRRESDARRPSNARKQSNANSLAARRASLDQYGHFDVHGRTITFHEHRAKGGGGRGGAGRAHKPKVPLSRDAKLQQRAQQKGAHAKRARHREKLILLKEEKDRFDMMREMQAHTSKFKQYYALSISVVTFGIVWCVGALVFMLAERRIQNITYFEALYFCYVSLLTIGYGDFSPKSNAGKPFFVVWSLVAIPTMTILVSEMGDTVVAAINRGTFTLADWTVMPKEGRWHDFLEAHPRLKEWLERRTKEREANKRIKHGFDLQNPDEEAGVNETNDPDPGLSQGKGLTLENLAEEPPAITEHDLARKLALAIKKTANDLRLPHHKKYSYEEWVEFTRLIRFSSKSAEEVEEDEEEEGLVEWDWIGEDSPMLADVSESEWILDRLCESLNRYTRKQALEVLNHFHLLRQKLTANEAKELQHHRDQRDPDSAIEINSPIQLNENSQKRRKKYHESHIQTYPAHPGLRSPTTIRPSRSISPAVVRRDFHEEHLKRAHVLDGKRVDSGGSGSGSTTESGAFSGSTTLASKSSEKENQQFLEEDEEDEEEDVKKEEELEKALDSLEVREWAAKADKPRYGDNVDLRFVGGG
jgi:potassium channel subfamily K